ncbi:hypothetical protein HaLaN_08139 [Haematococcus lacustris]|uniref:Uncharacterized protein n=1 Tax=Haematococcus lacustris TaxID=44745 RepID=A0A699YT88_HAELA|nr:hypothetical protein HaLaN_08139 [Haematococcus lacustris]
MKAFPACFQDTYSSLCMSLRLMVELLPDWRCRPAMLRLLVRTAAAGADAYRTLALLLDGAPAYEEEARLLSGLTHTPELKARTPKLEATLTCTLEVMCTQQLAPLALDLVWGMEGMMQVLRLAGPAYTFEEQPAAGNTAAVELCTLLLTDQEALCAVLGRQEEGLIMDQLISTCKAEAFVTQHHHQQL